MRELLLASHLFVPLMQDETKIRVWVDFWEERKGDFLSLTKDGDGGKDLHLLLEMMILELELEYPQFDLPQELAIPWHEYLWTEWWGCSLAQDRFAHIVTSAFLKPKCAIWDCPRPAIGSESWHDYCSMYHVGYAGTGKRALQAQQL